MDDEQKSAVKENVPKECPFCLEYNGEIWTEFKVLVGKYYYVDGGVVNEAMEDVVTRVMCTQCDEQIVEGKQ